MKKKPRKKPGPKPMPKERRRSFIFTLRVTEKERALLEAEAKKAKCSSIGKFLRRLFPWRQGKDLED